MKPTTKQIEALAREAGAAGDILQAAICAKAIGQPYQHLWLTAEDRARVDGMTERQARVICGAAIAEAHARA